MPAHSRSLNASYHHTTMKLALALLTLVAGAAAAAPEVAMYGASW